MHTFTSAVILSYAAILVAGGFIGWRVSGSRISLTASLLSALLLSIAYRLSQTSPAGGRLMATIVALALAVLFASRLRKTKKFMPSGMMLLLSIVVTVILAWSTARVWSG
jgi:uncharacterized membrane protein (UPF0136 family)